MRPQFLSITYTPKGDTHIARQGTLQSAPVVLVLVVSVVSVMSVSVLVYPEGQIVYKLRRREVDAEGRKQEE